MTHTCRSSGSTTQYSFTPYFAYRSRLTVQSRFAVDWDLISTTRSGAPRTLAAVMICNRSLDTNSRSGCTTSKSDSTTSNGAG